MTAVTELSVAIGIAAVCAVLGVSRASYYRARKRSRRLQDGGAVVQQGAAPLGVAPPTQGTAAASAADVVRKRVPRRLGDDERSNVLALLHEERFVDLSPAEVYATLLDEGQHHCSERTMYRILAANHEVNERRRQRRHPHYPA